MLTSYYLHLTGLMQQGPRGSPMDQSTFIHASRIAKDVAPGPSKDDAKPPPKS